MKKVTLLLIAFLIVWFLPGCTSIPAKLGIAESEWSDYSPQKQKLLLANYKKFIEKHKKEIGKKKDNDLFLEIKIHEGQVMMPPFGNWQHYKPVSFIIFKEQCRDIILQQPNNKNFHTELGVCFKENTLYLDPSHYDITKKNGSISINSSPLWISGFSYKGISSNGYARLNNVTVEIIQKEKIDRYYY